MGKNTTMSKGIMRAEGLPAVPDAIKKLPRARVTHCYARREGDGLTLPLRRSIPSFSLAPLPPMGR